MSTLLFNLVVDWIMQRTTEDQIGGIRWTPFSYLEGLDCADDLALLSHTHTHIQEETQRLNTFVKQVGLNISREKTEIMAKYTTDARPVQIDNEEPPYTDRFTYLGSISIDGGTDLDIQSRLNKARNSLNMMNKVWHSSTYSTLTKLKLYHSCVLSTLLNGSECWRLTENDLSKLSTFHTKSLRRILRIFWSNAISNKDLFERCETTNGYHPDEETLEVDCACHPSRIFHCKSCFTLDARRETQEGPPQGEDLGRHQAYGKGPADA